MTLEPAGKEGLRDQLRERIATDPAWFLAPLLLETLAAEESARLGRRARSRSRRRALKALVFSAAEARAQAGRAVAPAGGRAGQAVGRRCAASCSARSGWRRRRSRRRWACPRWRRAPATRGLGSAVAFVRRAGSADYLRLGLEARGAGRFTGTLPSLLASDGEWDVEYYVEGHDGAGAVTCRAGDADTPLRFRRAGTVTVTVPPARRAGTCGQRWPSSPPARRRPASTS